MKLDDNETSIYHFLNRQKVFMAMETIEREPESEDSGDIKKMLSKMVKDKKNKEFLDQIYYAFFRFLKK